MHSEGFTDGWETLLLAINNKDCNLENSLDPATKNWKLSTSLFFSCLRRKMFWILATDDSLMFSRNFRKNLWFIYSNFLMYSWVTFLSLLSYMWHWNPHSKNFNLHSQSSELKVKYVLPFLNTILSKKKLTHTQRTYSKEKHTATTDLFTNLLCCGEFQKHGITYFLFALQEMLHHNKVSPKVMS